MSANSLGEKSKTKEINKLPNGKNALFSNPAEEDIEHGHMHSASARGALRHKLNCMVGQTSATPHLPRNPPVQESSFRMSACQPIFTYFAARGIHKGEFVPNLHWTISFKSKATAFDFGNQFQSGRGSPQDSATDFLTRSSQRGAIRRFQLRESKLFSPSFSLLYLPSTCNAFWTISTSQKKK